MGKISIKIGAKCDGTIEGSRVLVKGVRFPKKEQHFQLIICEIAKSNTK